MKNQGPIVEQLHGQVASPHAALKITDGASELAECAESAVMPLTPSDNVEQNFHSAVLANLAEGVHLTRTRDCIIVYTNPRFDKMLGYGPGELIGQSVATLNAPRSDKSPGDIAQEIISTLNEKGSWSGEIQNITKAGAIIWCRANVSVCTHPEHGRVWISIHEDITQRQQGEAALAAKERQLRLITDHVPALIGYVDESLRYRFVNGAYERFFGKPRTQMIGSHVRDILGEEKFREVEEDMMQALAGKKASFEIEYLIQGKPVAMAVEYVPELDDRGRCTGFYVLANDISKRKRAETALRQNAERLRTIIQTAMDGFWRVDVRGRLLEVNDTYCLMSGYTAPELTGMSVTNLEADPDDHGIWSRIKTPMMPTEARFESRHRRKNGSEFSVEVSIQYRPEDGGHFIAFLHDISERQAAQEERSKLENQLQQSRKMEAVGQLAGGIAHDFNNILTAIIFQLELLEDDHRLVSKEPNPLLQELRSSAFRAADLTKQLLLFSRQQPIKTTRYNANVVIGEVTKFLSRLLGEHVTLVVNCHAEPLWIDGDISMFEQVVTNLSVNARDAMPNGGELTIEVFPKSCDADALKGHAEVQPGTFVCLRVADTGVGMSPMVLDRIFEPFFTTKPLGKGTGLGLATVHGIVSRHRGFIEVKSQLGKGSAFFVFLPRAAPADAVIERLASASSRGGHERILLVEDDPTVRQLASTCLSRLGYRVTEASSGVEALGVWKKSRGGFDLLFTDLVMPGGLSGLELSKRLTRMRSSLKTIIASGYNNDPVGDTSTWPRNVLYLQKPYSSTDLIAAVRTCVDPR